mmetsp:Transcript_12517/g.32021  ORF Transcript_12517/g.32021 Transcript_12517/m.32021 type:complete len:352 (-) Transcript_12517:1586-2641(-)
MGGPRRASHARNWWRIRGGAPSGASDGLTRWQLGGYEARARLHTRAWWRAGRHGPNGPPRHSRLRGTQTPAAHRHGPLPARHLRHPTPHRRQVGDGGAHGDGTRAVAPHTARRRCGHRSYRCRAFGSCRSAHHDVQAPGTARAAGGARPCGCADGAIYSVAAGGYRRAFGRQGFARPRPCCARRRVRACAELTPREPAAAPGGDPCSGRRGRGATAHPTCHRHTSLAAGCRRCAQCGTRRGARRGVESRRQQHLPAKAQCAAPPRGPPGQRHRVIGCGGGGYGVGTGGTSAGGRRRDSSGHPSLVSPRQDWSSPASEYLVTHARRAGHACPLLAVEDAPRTHPTRRYPYAG